MKGTGSASRRISGSGGTRYRAGLRSTSKEKPKRERRTPMTQSPVVSYDAVEEMAELYDHVPYYRQRADISFYVRETRAIDGPVLELASGTGRVLLPVARAGKRVVGLE